MAAETAKNVHFQLGPPLPLFRQLNRGVDTPPVNRADHIGYREREGHDRVLLGQSGYIQPS